MRMTAICTLGWDIGGVNTKVSRVAAGRVVDTLAALQQAPGERIAAAVAGEFASRYHPPEAGAGRTVADAEQGREPDQLRDRQTALVGPQ